MTLLASFDLETDLIVPGLISPPIVCGSYADTDGRLFLLTASQSEELGRELLRADTVVGGANLVYDWGCLIAQAERRSHAQGQELLDLVFAKYQRGDERTGEGYQVHDILIAQALDAIAGGHLFKTPSGAPLQRGDGSQASRYSLDICVKLVLGRDDAKARDFWRKRYAILRHLPFADWPEEARQYPLDDARNSLEVARVQREGRVFVPRPAGEECGWCGSLPTGCPSCTTPAVKPFRNLGGMLREGRADLALHLGALWGMRTDPVWVGQLEAEVEQQNAEYMVEFREFYKHGHERGCLRKLAKAGVIASDDKAIRLLTDDAVRDYPLPVLTKEMREACCVTSCSDGKEDGRKVKRLLAQAYGASGTCVACNGTGRRMGAKGNEVGCVPQYFKHEPDAICCDGTGLDLRPGLVPSLPRTDTGGVKADRDTLLESGDEQLMGYGDDEFQKTRTTHVPFLRKGTEAPLCLSPNVLVSSFRMSYFGPAQQLSREGKARACFRARGQK